MDLAEKLRPQEIADFRGEYQRQVAQRLSDVVAAGDVVQKLLITGPSGVGKTSLALFYAGLLGSVEVRHVNCIDNSGIDFVRNMITNEFAAGSLFHDYTMYILDEVHGWSGKAQEALLAEIEPPPPHIILVACTTEPDQLRSTLVSRFANNHFALRTPQKELRHFLKDLFDNLEITVVGPDVAESKNTIHAVTAREMLQRCGGNLRTLVNLVGQYHDGVYQKNYDTDDETQNIVAAIVKGNLTLQDLLRADVLDYNSLHIGLCRYAMAILRNNGHNTNAYKALRVFGRGLNPNTLPEIGFINLFMEYIEG